MLYPIESVLYFLLNFFYRCTENYGISILLISVTVSIATMPFLFFFEKLSKKPKAIKHEIDIYTDKINHMDISKEKKTAMRDSLYRQMGYNPLYAFYDALPLLIQLPFLIAMFYMVMEHKSLFVGHGFFFIKDLSAPDKLLYGVNLLPFLMTIINLIAAYIMPERGRKEFYQAIFMAVIFLLLLYGLPAALVLFWTFNNIITLAKYSYQRGCYAKQRN